MSKFALLDQNRIPASPGKGYVEIARPPHRTTAGDFHGHDAERAPVSLHEVITSWDTERQHQLFRILLPIDRLIQYGIDPITLTDAQERPITAC